MVIDAFVRVSLVGIELRLDLAPEGQPRKLTKVVGELKEGSDHKVRTALSHVKETASELIGSLRHKATDKHDEQE
jgi:hypothetical protein